MRAGWRSRRHGELEREFILALVDGSRGDTLEAEGGIEETTLLMGHMRMGFTVLASARMSVVHNFRTLLAKEPASNGYARNIFLNYG
jgi:hypothetical protein